MSKRRQAALAGAATAVMLLSAACGSAGADGTGSTDSVQPAGDSYSTSGGYGDTSGSSGAQPQGNTANSGPAKQLAVRSTAQLGEVVTDSKGFTLYRFEEDSADPPASVCNGQCAEAWPPVPAADATASDGIDQSLLGKVQRDDGTEQLTMAGWPVYRYAKDTAAGDTKGHGVNGTWNALGSDGKPAGSSATAEGDSPADGDPELSTVNDADLGTIVVDGERRTLYRFDKDSAWPMKTSCTDACLDTWKPAKPVDKDKVEGVDPEDVIIFDRPDGTKQLTIDCWPVYWFTGDTEPGDTNGHGKMGVWWAVTPEGKKAASASAS